MSLVTAIPAGAAPSRTPQLNGDLLLYALVPDSAFGPSYSSEGVHSTGRKLVTARARYHVPSMSCATFENYTRVGEYGDTAGAWDEFYNPDWLSEWPTVVSAVQSVNQFPSDNAAMSFYRQELAKYQACGSFTQPDPGNRSPGGGDLEIAATQVAKTLIGRNLAFQVTQSLTISSDARVIFFLNNLIVVSGTDVYQFWDLSGTNDEPWPSLMAKLIRNVQQLR